MATLWLKFPEEMLADVRFTETDHEKLERIFSTAPESAWGRALTLIGVSGPEASLIFWHRGAPYFNWSYLVALLSGGIMRAVPMESGYSFTPHYSLRAVMRLIAAQWKMARLTRKVPEGIDPLVESIALGLASQALLMRLGPQATHMAQWLAAPGQAPKQYRAVIAQIQDIQIRRTRISSAWREIFPQGGMDDGVDLPDFFWDDNIPASAAPSQGRTVVTTRRWKGAPVCAGTVTGLAVAVRSARDIDDLATLRQRYNAPLILVFRHARPQAVELYQHADAVLFAEGGVLSHACVVAREMNIPAITALGVDFFTRVELSGRLWLSVDGAAAVIEITQD